MSKEIKSKQTLERKVINKTTESVKNTHRCLPWTYIFLIIFYASKMAVLLSNI